MHGKSVCKGCRFGMARQNLLCAMGGCGSVQYRFGGVCFRRSATLPERQPWRRHRCLARRSRLFGTRISGMVDWGFVEEAEVPAGPWSVCCRLEREEPRIEYVDLRRGILGPLNTKRVVPHKSEKGIPGSCFRSGSFKKDFTLIEVSRF